MNSNNNTNIQDRSDLYAVVEAIYGQTKWLAAQVEALNGQVSQLGGLPAENIGVVSDFTASATIHDEADLYAVLQTVLRDNQRLADQMTALSNQLAQFQAGKQEEPVEMSPEALPSNILK